MSDFFSLLDIRLAVSLGVPALIAVAGWFLAHWLNARREVTNKRRELRLKGLEAAYMRLAMSSLRDWTDTEKLGFEQFIAEIQLYGTPRQIELTIELVKAFVAREPKVSFDSLLENLRDSLRAELRMEKVGGPIWWYRFRMPAWSTQPGTPSSESISSTPEASVGPAGTDA